MSFATKINCRLSDDNLRELLALKELQPLLTFPGVKLEARKPDYSTVNNSLGMMLSLEIPADFPKKNQVVKFLFGKISICASEIHIHNSVEEKRKPKSRSLLGLPISELGVSVRTENCLESERINNLGQLVAKSADNLLELRNFGKSTLQEVRQALTKIGLKLRNDE